MKMGTMPSFTVEKPEADDDMEKIGGIILDLNIAKGEVEPADVEIFVSQLKPEFKKDFDKMSPETIAGIVGLDKMPENVLRELIRICRLNKNNHVFNIHDLNNLLAFSIEAVDPAKNSKYLHLGKYMDELIAKEVTAENEKILAEAA